MPQLTNDKFVKENVAIVHVYNQHLHFLKRKRGEVSFNIYRKFYHFTHETYTHVY
jgi:hypothetical protein